MAEWITAEQLAERLVSGDPPVLIDVRMGSADAIAGSRHVPVIDLEDKSWDWDASRDLVVYCHFGRGASDYAAEVLEEQGYRRVFKLKGGLEAWQAHVAGGGE